jgi:hypothetical protein
MIPDEPILHQQDPASGVRLLLRRDVRDVKVQGEGKTWEGRGATKQKWGERRFVLSSLCTCRPILTLRLSHSLSALQPFPFPSVIHAAVSNKNDCGQYISPSTSQGRVVRVDLVQGTLFLLQVASNAQ